MTCQKTGLLAEPERINFIYFKLVTLVPVGVILTIIY